MTTSVPYQKWLDSLKVGSTVVVYQYSTWPEYRHQICTVSHITPSRMFDVDGGRFGRFDKKGQERGASSPARLMEPTPQLLAEIQHIKNVKKLEGVKWKDLSPDTVAAVIKALEVSL